MKKSVIKDIFYGFRGHIDSMVMPKCDNDTKGRVCDIYDELKEKFSPELLTLHQKFVDAFERNWSAEVDFYFVEGFKLGLLIGIESMEK